MSYADTCINGKPAALLDILEVDLTSKNPGTKYQRENRIMRAKPWRVVGSLKPSALIKYCSDASPILHSTGDRVDTAQLEAIPSSGWDSLRLIHPRMVHFSRDFFSKNRWRAYFSDAKSQNYDLKITDPIASGRLNHDEKIGQDCILTVSMTEPWSPDVSKPPMCYKLVAAVIELPK